MDILSLSYQYPSQANIKGGIFVHKLNQKLVERGLTIDVISPVPYVPAPFDKIRDWGVYPQIDRERVLDGIHVDHPRYVSLPVVSSQSLNAVSLTATVGPRVLHAARDTDVIHAHTVLPDGILGRFLSVRTNTPCVVTARGQDLKEALSSTVGRHLLKFVYSGCQHAVFVSNALRNDAAPVVPTSTDCSVVHDGVALEDIAPLDDDDEEDDKFEILSVGALKDYKGHQYTIEAVGRLRDEGADVTLTIIGGSNQYEEELRDLVTELGLSDVVDFEGRIPHDAVMRAMAKCDVFVLPSWQEGFGVVYVEAMAHGRPAIGCQGVGPADSIVDDETGYLVPQRSVSALVDRIWTLYENPSLIDQMGAAGRERVRERFTYEETARKYAEIYDAVV